MTDTPPPDASTPPLQRTARKADFSMYGSPDFSEAPPVVVGVDLEHVPGAAGMVPAVRVEAHDINDIRREMQQDMALAGSDGVRR